MTKLYSEALINGRVVQPKETPDEYDTVWELTEFAPEKYRIDVWPKAYKRVLANPQFLSGASVFGIGKGGIEVKETGVAEKNSDGRLVVIKQPKIELLDYQPERKKVPEPEAKKPGAKTGTQPEVQQAQNAKKDEFDKAAKQVVQGQSTEILYSDALIDGEVLRPQKRATHDTVWELEKTGPDTYKIVVWSEAYGKVLANPSFLDGARKQVLNGANCVNVVKPGVVKVEANGKFKVVEEPQVNLIRAEHENDR